MDYRIEIDVRDSDKVAVANFVQAVTQDWADALGYPEDCDIAVKQREVGDWVAADLTDD